MKARALCAADVRKIPFNVEARPEPYVECREKALLLCVSQLRHRKDPNEQGCKPIRGNQYEKFFAR
jgi:hypothetical protein